MTPRQGFKQLAADARKTAKEAQELADFYTTRAAAIETMLSVCSDAQCKTAWDKLCKEAPGVLKS